MATTTQTETLHALALSLFDIAPGGYLPQLQGMISTGQSVTDIANWLTGLAEFKATHATEPLAFANQLVGRLLGVSPDAFDTALVSADAQWARDWALSNLQGGMSQGELAVTAITALLTTDAAAFAPARDALVRQITVSSAYAAAGGKSEDFDLLAAVVADVDAGESLTDRTELVATLAASERTNGDLLPLAEMMQRWSEVDAVSLETVHGWVADADFWDAADALVADALANGWLTAAQESRYEINQQAWRKVGTSSYLDGQISAGIEAAQDLLQSELTAVMRGTVETSDVVETALTGVEQFVLVYGLGNLLVG